MKRNKLYLYFLLLFFMFLITCKKENIKVETGEVSGILATTAKITGYIIGTGDGIKYYGHCYSKTPNPTILDSKTEFAMAIGLGVYTSFLQDLEPGVKYYAKAYLLRDNVAIYGNEINFTTASADLPELTTTVVTDITQTTAVSGGNITSDGGAPVFTRGVCWSILPGPTISDSKTTNGPGTGTFISNLTGLTSMNKYYIRAYAINGAGTSYGNELNFTTAK